MLITPFRWTQPLSANPGSRRAEAAEEAERIFRAPRPETEAQTRIVATIGPTSKAPETIAQMLAAGMDVARLNASHLKPESRDQFIDAIRTASAQAGKPVSILLDMPGPKVRIGELPGGEMLVTKGEELVLGEGGIPFEPRNLIEAMQKDRTVLLKDGAVPLTVIENKDGSVRCRIESDGKLTSRCGVAVRGANLRIPAFTEADREHLEWGLQKGVDLVAVSKVQCAEDMNQVRRFCEERGYSLPLCSKIEDVRALKNLDEIILASDVVMVARGDLGVECPPEYVPALQKMIVARCRELGKPCIVATEMMLSMVDKPRPTRAEGSDVENAVWDGAQATMLSDESTVGKNPVGAVRSMDTHVRVAELAGCLTGHIPFSPVLWQTLLSRVTE